MTCIRFDFLSDVTEEKRAAFLAGINSSWTAVQEAGRLKASEDDASASRQCYLKLVPGQVDIDRIARSLAAALRATTFIENAFIVDEGWPIPD
jgi:hypothetical protein